MPPTGSYCESFDVTFFPRVEPGTCEESLAAAGALVTMQRVEAGQGFYSTPCLGKTTNSNFGLQAKMGDYMQVLIMIITESSVR